MVQWLSLLHNFIQKSLNSGSAQVQILLAECRRYVMVRISDCGSLVEIRLNAFHWSTIPQKQLIIITIIIIIIINHLLIENYYVKFHSTKSFIEEPNITKYSSVFKNYGDSFAVEVLDSRDSHISLILLRLMLKINQKLIFIQIPLKI